MNDEHLESVLRSMGEAVLLEDADRIVVFANDAFARIFLGGAPPSVMLGVDCRPIAQQSAEAFAEVSAWLERTETIVQERTEVRDEPWQLADGRWLERDYLPRFDGADFAGHAWVYRDISTRELMRQQLKDASTELASANHRRTAGATNFDPESSALRAAIDTALATGPVALALLKIVNLDRINSESGHAAADAFLASVAPKVQTILPTSSVERIAGATFSITVPGHSDAEEVLRATREGLGTTATIDGRTVLLRVSIGAASIDPNSGEVDSRLLIKQARLALSEARRLGRDLAFDQELVERERRRDQLGLALPAAIRDGELSLVYQPIARLSDGLVVAHESLVRWARPGFGTLTAASFIPVAEAMGIARDLDLWAIDHLIGEASKVLALGGQRVGVNVSNDSLREPGLIANAFKAALERHGEDPARFVVELTETAAAESSQVRDEMNAISELGVKIAMDDFGVGSSSLAMLADTKFDYIKLDKFFTRGLADTRVRSLVSATCQLAAAFDAQVVAEGVEEEKQIKPLIACGAEFGQGWFIGVPTPLLSP